MNFLDTIKGLYDTVIDGVKMRVVNPLASGFLFAWLVFNWKPLYYFFVETGTAEDKISHIEMFYSDNTFNLYLPAGIALAYVFVFPLLTQASTSIWTIMDKWGSSLANRVIPRLSPISKAEKAALINMINTKNSELVKQVKEKDAEIEALTNLVKPEAPEATIEPDINDNSVSQAIDEMEGEEIKRKVKASDNKPTPEREPSTQKVRPRRDYSQDNIKREYKKAPHRWDDYDFTYFKTTNGKHLLREILCKELRLSRDNPILNTEVEIASAIFETLMSSATQTIKPIAIKAKVDGTVTTFDVNRVSAMAEKLFNFGLLGYVTEGYSFSEKGMLLLVEAYEENIDG